MSKTYPTPNPAKKQCWLDLLLYSVHFSFSCFLATMVVAAWFTFQVERPSNFPTVLVATGPGCAAMLLSTVGAFVPSILPSGKNRWLAVWTFPGIYLAFLFAVHVMFTGERVGPLSRFDFLPGDAWRDPIRWGLAYLACVLATIWSTRTSKVIGNQ